MPTPKKPIEHHIKTGNFRPGKHAGPSLPVEVPQMPGDLSPAAQALWKIVTEQLRFAGTVSRIDGQGLRLLVESWSLYIDACDAVTKHGVVVEEVTAKGQSRLRQNPAILVRAKAWKEIQTMLGKFGLTPADRTGLAPGAVGGSKSEEEKVASILGFGVVG